MLHPELLQCLCQTRDWLREDAEPRLSVNATARRAGIARHHFIRLFRTVFGETPHQYRSLAQIERAKELLIVTDRSITDICMAIGFSSLGSFSTLFARRTGLSPSAWRRKHRPTGAGPHAMPPALIPGCLSLMAGFPAEKAISKKRPRRIPAKLGRIPS